MALALCPDILPEIFTFISEQKKDDKNIADTYAIFLFFYGYYKFIPHKMERERQRKKIVNQV